MSDIIEKIDLCFEEQDGLTDEKYSTLDSEIKTSEDLEECLPEIKQRTDNYKKQADACDEKIKDWTDSKKMWQMREKQLKSFLEHTLSRLKITSIAKNNIKVKITSRTVTKVDETAIINAYKPLVDQVQAQLPEYLKLSLTVDKTALTNYLKKDDTLMKEHPEIVHSETSTSLRLS